MIPSIESKIIPLMVKLEHRNGIAIATSRRLTLDWMTRSRLKMTLMMKTRISVSDKISLRIVVKIKLNNLMQQIVTILLMKMMQNTKKQFHFQNTLKIDLQVAFQTKKF